MKVLPIPSKNSRVLCRDRMPCVWSLNKWPGKSPRQQRGYLLTEALVYIGLVFVLLGVAYAGLYHFIDNSVVLGRNAQDVSRALHAGERWRQDVRSANSSIKMETSPEGETLRLSGRRGEVSYTAREGALWRRIDQGPWVRVLKDVKSSLMQADVQPQVTAWRWELELQPQTKAAIKAGRVRPLFTFLAAEQHQSNP